MKELTHFINGQHVKGTSGRFTEVFNPATGEVIAEIQQASGADVDTAVESALQGQKVWAAMTGMERSRILRRAVDLLRERNDELAVLESLDTGKPVSLARRVDISRAIANFRFFAGAILCGGV